jgi:UDPglucose--hexose-1-phosphate uridylyltransferase
LLAEPERGLCRVLCFHPNHSLTLARMAVPDIVRVVDAWAAETAAFGDLPWINHVQIFENRGAMMGASNPHPHCQIWATEHIPDLPLRELAAQQSYHEEHHTCLLCDYLAAELAPALAIPESPDAPSRIVVQNDLFVALVPFWATWPFETLVLPRRHIGSLADLTSAERTALAAILKAVTTRYDNLFLTSFPYTMGFHQRPTHGQAHDSMHLHAHFLPPLLRSAEIRKFMVGFEMLAMPQRDLTPETTAARLRALPDKHYAE